MAGTGAVGLDGGVLPSRSWASDEATRRKMVGNRGRDTKPELAVRSLVHKKGLRYRVDERPVPSVRRRADLVFRRARIAVFIDGCYWHGCEAHYREPRTNVGYWREKIAANRARDRETNLLLADEGWQVLRYWEHEDPEHVANAIAGVVADRLAGEVPGSGGDHQ